MLFASSPRISLLIIKKRYARVTRKYSSKNLKLVNYCSYITLVNQMQFVYFHEKRTELYETYSEGVSQRKDAKCADLTA